MKSLLMFRSILKNYPKFNSVIHSSSLPVLVVNYRASASLSNVYRPYDITRTFQSTPDSIRVEFRDSLNAEFYYVWLRDSCSCEKCVHPITQEKFLDPVSINLSINPKFCHVNNRGKLNIIWNETNGEHTSYYNPMWLHRYGSGFERNLYETMHDRLPPVEYWKKEKGTENLPEIQYEAVMQSKRGKIRCLEAVYKNGIVVLKNVPCEPGEVVTVMNRITHVTNSRWGSSFHIITNDDFNVSLPPAETGLELHTDMNYLEKSPGIQVFHCLKARYESAYNLESEDAAKFYFVDGFYAAKWLQENYPVYFEALTSFPVKFKKFTQNMQYSNYHPVLRLNRSRNVTEVHFNNRTMAPLEGPQNSILNFYAGYQLFGEFIRRNENQFSMLIRPGDMIILNNRRILHGRKGFDPNLLSRHIEGCYADIDEVLARYRSFLWKKVTMRK